MRLLFVSNLYPPNVVGGYEVLCADVAAELALRGHTVSVLTSCYGGLVSAPPGQRVHQALQLLVGKTVYDAFDGDQQRRHLLDRQNATALRRAIMDARPDMIFSWNLYGLGPCFFESLPKFGVPVTVMLTDNWLASMLNPGHVDAYFRDAIYSKNVQRLPGQAGNTQCFEPHVSAIFGSKFMRDFYHRCGVDFRSARVVHNGVEHLQVDDDTLVPRGQLREQGIVKLLFAGRVVEIKGAHTAIEALDLLNRRGDGFSYQLHIVGDARDGVYLERLKALATELGCLEQVKFSPPVKQEALFDLFQAHDIYLFPSLYEPFSLTLIHALSAGIPTVASRAGGNSEIIDERRSGLLFETGKPADLAEAVGNLVDDGALRHHLSQQSRAISASYSARRMIDEMEHHLLSLVAR